MKELAFREIKNEQLKKLFNTFFDIIQMSLKIKDDNRSSFSKMLSDRDLRSLVKNKEALQFKHFDSFIKNLQALEKNQAYLDTTEWKILAFLSPNLMDSKNPSALHEALDYLNKFQFLEENNFSVIKVASIIYSLSQSDPLNAAKMLVRLHYFNLLTEQNLGKISASSELNSQLFSSVLNKLSLIGESGGTAHLLTQANLDKLLQNPDLNLEMLSQFIQAEDKSKILTQEKFDIVIQNIDKIEKTGFDTKELADVISLLDQANILTQDNFDSLINLSKTDFEKIVPALRGLDKTGILTEANLYELLNTSLATRIYDEQNEVDSANGQQSFKSSLTDKLYKMLKDLFDKASGNIQAIFDKIIAGFNKITKRYETPDISESEAQRVTGNHNSFFVNSYSSQSENSDTKVLPSNLVNTR